MTQTSTITITDPLAPATEKQLAFLTSLVKDRECPGVAEKFRFSTTVGFLAKGAASKLIDEALKAPKKGAAPAATAAALAELHQAPKLTELPAFGYYEIDGTVYHWDVTGKDFAPTLRVLAKIKNWDGKVKGSWKKYSAPWAEYKSAPKVTGTFKYKGKGPEMTKVITVPKILADAVLAGAIPMTLEQVAVMGKAFTFCIRCGATLTDPVSVADGIGPVCKSYFI